VYCEMGGTCSMDVELRMHSFYPINRKLRDHLRDMDIDERLILKYTFRN
jgi:hypothetical protein